MATLLKLLVVLYLAASTLSAPARDDMISVNQASFEKAMAMMQESDDWMNTLKLMMKNGTRGFKVESRRVIEYGDTSDQGGNEGVTTLTMSEDMLPLVTPSPREIEKATPKQHNWQEKDFPIFRNQPKHIEASEIVMGDVGLCKTRFKVETIHTAILMREPDAPKATLAHPIPAAIGECRHDFPPNGAGSLNGKCVVAAQAHIAWILVPEERSKEFKNCLDIPGVSSVKKCSDWIVVGGRCVYETRM